MATLLAGLWCATNQSHLSSGTATRALKILVFPSNVLPIYHLVGIDCAEGEVFGCSLAALGQHVEEGWLRKIDGTTQENNYSYSDWFYLGIFDIWDGDQILYSNLANIRKSDNANF